MDEPLTGRAAAEALGLYSRLAATGASFDARKVARDVRTRAGRGRLAVALIVGVRRVLADALPVRPMRRRRGLRRVLRAAQARAVPARPSDAREGVEAV